jgi:hypothetical protein
MIAPDVPQMFYPGALVILPEASLAAFCQLRREDLVVGRVGLEPTTGGL